MLCVYLVFLADVFQQFFLRAEAGGEIDRERFGVCTRIDDSGLHVQSSKIFARVALDGVKLFRVRVTRKIEPELVVIPNSIDYQRVALILAGRVAVPGGIRVAGMFASIHEDLPVAVNVSFKQEENMRGGLYDPPRVGSDARNSSGQAVCLWIVLRLARL